MKIWNSTLKLWDFEHHDDIRMIICHYFYFLDSCISTPFFHHHFCIKAWQKYPENLKKISLFVFIFLFVWKVSFIQKEIWKQIKIFSEFSGYFCHAFVQKWWWKNGCGNTPVKNIKIMANNNIIIIMMYKTSRF